MNLFWKILAFLFFSIVGITLGAIFLELAGIPKRNLPAIIGVITGALGWKFVASKQSKD